MIFCCLSFREISSHSTALKTDDFGQNTHNYHIFIVRSGTMRQIHHRDMAISGTMRQICQRYGNIWHHTPDLPEIWQYLAPYARFAIEIW